MIWGLRLRTRLRDRQRVAKESSPFPPDDLKKVEIHLVKRVGALATDCSAHLNQPRRARNQHVDGRARRTRAGS